MIRFDLARNVALFAPGIEIPLVPFMGIMAVAPPRDTWLISSRPPGRYGGNMDFNKLTAGATLYLPVFHNGAQFFTGDSHAVQADGEVNGTAIEASLTATLQFIVHKGAGAPMKWPRAEDATHYYVMGMDVDLDTALREAVRETVNFLRERQGTVGGRRLFAREHRGRLPGRGGRRRRADDLWRDPEENLQAEPGLLAEALTHGLQRSWSLRASCPASLCAGARSASCRRSFRSG